MSMIGNIRRWVNKYNKEYGRMGEWVQYEICWVGWMSTIGQIGCWYRRLGEWVQWWIWEFGLIGKIGNMLGWCD